MSNSFAQEFALGMHAGQRYGALPYAAHLYDVVRLVNRYYEHTVDLRVPLSVLLDAAWLHDVCEDQGVSVEQIHKLFGCEVGDIVAALTVIGYPNRAASRRAAYNALKGKPAAVFVKLCDRIANVEAGGRWFEMYQREHEDFERALRVDGQFAPMWDHLDALFAVVSEDGGANQ